MVYLYMAEESKYTINPMNYLFNFNLNHERIEWHHRQCFLVQFLFLGKIACFRSFCFYIIFGPWQVVFT